MCRLNASRRRACARIHYSPGGLPSSYRYPLLPCTRIFENSQKKSKAGADQDFFSKMAGAAGKKSGIPEKKPRFRVPSPQDLGIPIGQIRSPSYASRTLAPSSQSMHSQNSRARSRSLSYDSSRSVRARPATAPAPTANSAVAAAIPAPDAPDAGHQAAPDALDDGAGLGTSPQGGTAN